MPNVSFTPETCLVLVFAEGEERNKAKTDHDVHIV